MSTRARIGINERAKLGLRGRRVVDKDRIIKARKEAASGAELGKLSVIFRALHDPAQLRLMQSLGGGEMCVCDLAAFLEMSESAASHRLRKLRGLGLVEARREGRVMYYQLADRHVERLIKIGLEHVREGRD